MSNPPRTPPTRSLEEPLTDETMHPTLVPIHRRWLDCWRSESNFWVRDALQAAFDAGADDALERAAKTADDVSVTDFRRLGMGVYGERIRALAQRTQEDDCTCQGTNGLHNTADTTSPDPKHWRGHCPVCGKYVPASCSPRTHGDGGGKR